MNSQPSLSSVQKPLSRLRRGLVMTATVFVAALGTHAALAGAQTPPPAPLQMQQGGPGMRHSGRGMERMFSQIGATPEQIQQIRAIQKQSWEKSRPGMEQMRQLTQERMKLLSQPQIDRSALENLRVKQMDLASQLSRDRAQTQYQVAEVLKPEQRAQLYAMLEQRMQRMEHKGWRQGGPGMGGPGMMFGH